jgi:carbonic anhydrase/acetyltransferase-like protein (isoleucine patch superfamily)
VIYTLDERRPEFRGDTYVAPDATLIGSVVMGHESSVWFKSIVRADNEPITIGERSNVQDACVLHVDDGVPLTVGSNVSIGHQVTLHGCTIHDGCLIGINAVVLNHAVIGEDSIVGASTLITEGKEIPPRSLVVGSPGRVVRTLTDEQVAGLRDIAQHYVDKSKLYRTSLREWQG